MKVTAIVLAAGLSRRMGQQNKLLLPWQDGTILGTVLKAVQESMASEVVLVVGHEKDKVQQLPEVTGTRVVVNDRFKEGMTSSIQCGIGQTPKDHGLLICAGDMPLLEPEDYNKLLCAYQDQAIVVPKYLDRQRNPVLFGSQFRQALLNHRQPEGCKGVIAAHLDRVNWIKGSNRNVIDIDTEKDLR